MSTVPLREAAVAAFPPALAEQARCAAGLFEPGPYPPADPFAVSVDGHEVRIPYRVYDVPPPTERLRGLEPTTSDVLHCLLTRHHDGYVRQRAVERVAGADAEWVPPFVVALLGEYVLEVVLALQPALAAVAEPGSWQRARYGRFAAGDPAFLALTRQRAASYWACYHRSRYPRLGGYPALPLLAAIESAGAAGAAELVSRR